MKLPRLNKASAALWKNRRGDSHHQFNAFLSIVGHVPHVSGQLLATPLNWHRVSCSFSFLPAHSQFLVAMPFRLNSGLSLQQLVSREAMQFPVILPLVAQLNGVRFLAVTVQQSIYIVEQVEEWHWNDAEPPTVIKLIVCTVVISRKIIKFS